VKAAGCSEIPVLINQTAKYHIPEDHSLQRRELFGIQSLPKIIATF
jgi:hypothetical protein